LAVHHSYSHGMASAMHLFWGQLFNCSRPISKLVCMALALRFRDHVARWVEQLVWLNVEGLS
jgi:hypothetical protein